MPTSWSGSIVCSAPLSVSLIRTSRMRARLSGRAPRAPVRARLVGAVARGGLRFLARVSQPGRAVVLGDRLDLAPRFADAGANLLLGGGTGAFLAAFRLLLDPLGLGLQLILGAGAGDVLGLALDLLDQPTNALLSFAADLLGPFHDPLLDLGLQLDRGLVGGLGAGLRFGCPLLGFGDALVGVGLDPVARLLDPPVDLGAHARFRHLDLALRLRLDGVDPR